MPVPNYGPGVYQEHALFGDWLNDQILGSWQTKWRFGWILGIMPHSATAMLGVLAGEICGPHGASGGKSPPWLCWGWGA